MITTDVLAEVRRKQERARIAALVLPAIYAKTAYEEHFETVAQKAVNLAEHLLQALERGPSA